MAEENNVKGNYPLEKDHICFQNGHTMYNQFIFHNHSSSYGTNKCGRCGFEEEFQYDHIGFNPMYHE